MGEDREVVNLGRDESRGGEHGDASVLELGLAELREIVLGGEAERVEESVPEGWGGAELVRDWEGCPACFGGWIEEGREGRGDFADSFFGCFT